MYKPKIFKKYTKKCISNIFSFMSLTYYSCSVYSAHEKKRPKINNNIQIKLCFFGLPDINTTFFNISI